MERRILVVDDEATIREFMSDHLLALGYVPFVAADADEAMSIFLKEEIFVVILDLKLFGLNGIELCRKMRRERPLAMIFAMTGWAALFEIEECREAGFDDYFQKPLPPDLIASAVAEAFAKIERWRGRRPARPAP